MPQPFVFGIISTILLIMVKINRITHKNSDVANKAPSAEDILNGEIAVNYAKDTERLYIKNKGGKIIPFSSDHIKIDSIINTVLMDNTMGKGYDVSNPTLANVYGSKEALNMVLKHYKMGLFKDGTLVKECAPCRITKAVDGSDINIDGSEGDIMLYTDTPIYRDRCRVSGVTVPNSTATTHNMIGLGLVPHQIGWKDAKKMNPFAFTPGSVQFDGKEYRSCYNTTYNGSGLGDGKIAPLFTTNFIGENGAQGGYPVMCQSAVDSMQRSRNKGPKYQGIFYEFYEMWLIAMYLELGSLYFTDIDSFGYGCTRKTPNASNWISGSISGARINDEGGNGVNVYVNLCDYRCAIGENGAHRSILEGLLGGNTSNFEEALESQRFVDALVKSNLASKVDGKTVLEYDDNKNGYVKVSDGVDVASGNGMKEGKKYYVIRNVPKCQGIGDGVMTYVLNVFVKTTFNSNVYHDDVNVGGKEIIFKFSYPTYRGLELFSGAETQIEGIHHVIGRYENGTKTSIWYAKDYTDIKYNPSGFTNADARVRTTTPDEDIPYIKGFVKAWEYSFLQSGGIKNVNYDVSLYCVTECGFDISNTTYECGNVLRSGNAFSGMKHVTASNVGCGVSNADGDNANIGRTLSAGIFVNGDNNYVGKGFNETTGGFSIGNPSL